MRKIIFNVFIPLILGTSIYMTSRYDTRLNLFFYSFNKIDLPAWIKYNLPDGLWMFALLSSIKIVWKDEHSYGFLMWTFLVMILSFATELFQFYKLLPGTYDKNDLNAYLIAITVFFSKEILLNDTNLKTIKSKSYEN